MRRERTAIIHDILKVIQDKGEKVRPTHILYKSNLSSQMLKDYLTELIDKGFIEEKEDKRSKRFALTDKGHKYIQDYCVIKSFIESYGLEE